MPNSTGQAKIAELEKRKHKKHVAHFILAPLLRGKLLSLQPTIAAKARDLSWEGALDRGGDRRHMGYYLFISTQIGVNN
jgi:hypothetical protein